MGILNLIKYKIRSNQLFIKYFQNIITSLIYNLKNFYFYIQYYNFKKHNIKNENTIYFILDPNLSHPGFADRIKVAVCIYYIAKENGFSFKMIFETPFCLSNYLEENEVSWIAKYEDLSYSIFNSRLLAYNGYSSIPKLNKKIKQYHIYFYNGKNILQLNCINDSEKIWNKLYNALFKPSLLLNAALEKQVFKENEYVAIHLRFVNAFERIEDGYYNGLDNYKKDTLIYKCFALFNIAIPRELPILLFSDSNYFLEAAKKNGFNTLDGKVGHISFSNENEEVFLKTVLDFYMLSRAKKIYRVVSPEMYNSAFSYYAALIGNKEFETIRI